jgi:hypothetical protein
MHVVLAANLRNLQSGLDEGMLRSPTWFPDFFPPTGMQLSFDTLDVQDRAAAQNPAPQPDSIASTDLSRLGN